MAFSGRAGVSGVATRGLTKVYASGPAHVVALSDVTFRAGPGEFVAIVGPANAGKSALMHCLSGDVLASSGSVEITGKNITRMRQRPRARLLRKTVGSVFEDLALVPELSVRDNILHPAHKRISEKQFGVITSVLNLGEILNLKPNELSYGQRQLVAVARAIVCEPKLIILDDPTSFLDQQQAQSVVNAIRLLVDHDERTVVMATGDLCAAAEADRVVFLESGSIVGQLDDPSISELQEIVGSKGRSDDPNDGEDADGQNKGGTSWEVTLTDDTLPGDLSSENASDSVGATELLEPSSAASIATTGSTPVLSQRQVEVIDRAKQILDSLPGAVAPDSDWIEDAFSEDQNSPI